MHRLFPHILISTALTFAAGAAHAGCAFPPADPDLMRTVAMSDVVVEGSIALSPDQLTGLHGKDAWTGVPFAVTRTLKGPAADTVTVQFYPVTDQAPALSDLELAAGHRVIVYLHRLSVAGPGGLYFAAGAGSLKPAPEALATGAEIARQDAVLKNWTADAGLPHFAEVKALLAQLTAIHGTGDAVIDQQQAIFETLEALGPDAVPAIVAQMDDRRPLAAPVISLKNLSPGAFEATRHYGPKTVVEALDAVLNQITGEFGTIYNGGSDAERDSAVAAWRVYAHDRMCG
ncbi:hypothetical protein [Asticcacaulis solisilvae]|uniref:hypothetical protein n=1 Tax=Asticcacaulis solisilvae TaxID=1217274 RepID=UPI003FD79963